VRESQLDSNFCEGMQFFAPQIQRAQGKERRKVGRPIMHKGDPDDPTLTEKERRRIKRRIANRESARRVRYRRQEELEEMQLKGLCFAPTMTCGRTEGGGRGGWSSSRLGSIVCCC